MPCVLRQQLVGSGDEVVVSGCDRSFIGTTAWARAPWLPSLRANGKTQ